MKQLIICSEQLNSSSQWIRVLWCNLLFCKAIMHKVHLLMITLIYCLFPCGTLFLFVLSHIFLKMCLLSNIFLRFSFLCRTIFVLFLLSVSKRHWYMLCSVMLIYFDKLLGAISITPTLLRLIPSLEGSDGRCVHVLDLFSWKFIVFHYYQVHLFAEL